jgi:uncharacterized protein
MKHLVGILLLFITSIVFAQDFPEMPNPPKLVNDYASVLSDTQRNSLEQKLVAFDDSTSTQIAIAIINSTKGYPISSYAVELGENWGVGRDGKDNGVMILVAIEDRDIFIATGYGLEGALPDALVKRIIENDIKPAFREGSYFEGLDRASTNMLLLSRGEYKAEKRKPKSFPWIIVPIILFFLLLPGAIAVRNARQYSALNDVPFWTAWMLLNQAKRTHSGRYGGWTSGGGGFGGSSGGGFGGFGGGGFGGGGAGGSW